MPAAHDAGAVHARPGADCPPPPRALSRPHARPPPPRAQGETFTAEQATELFFRVTKLFQCKDVYLRRLVYLLIKELANSADQVIIVTNCLQQDINRTEQEMFRSNAMRVLCRIIDSAMLGQIGAPPPASLRRACARLTQRWRQTAERLIKQTITDNSPSVASAGLVSAIFLMKDNGDVYIDVIEGRTRDPYSMEANLHLRMQRMSSAVWSEKPMPMTRRISRA